MGGEKSFRRLCWVLLLGSPPRGRGKAQAFRVRPVGRGITPAWAGKRPQLERPSPLTQDHPRVGGEKAVHSPSHGSGSGSPPRGRGKGPTAGRWAHGTRITPAWAGKRRRYRLSTRGGRDHPRVGGEKPSWIWYSEPHLGSPPRGRGKVPCSVCQCFGAGITPAWAGKSSRLSMQVN